MAQRGSWASYVIWGSVAVCAVLAASVTIALVVGAHRGIQFAGSAKRPGAAAERTQLPAAVSQPANAPVSVAGTSPVPGSASLDLARIDDALRSLTAERNSLMERVERIERAVGDITASVDNRAAPGEPDAEPVAAIRSLSARPGMEAVSLPDPLEILRPYIAARPFVSPPLPTQAAVQIRAAPSQDAPRATESTIRTEFAVDLGGGPSLDGLRALWGNLRGNHGAALGNLRPLVSIQEGGRGGGTELRLLAGPLANAGAAARICAALQAKGVACQTAVFDGQRLALR